MTGLTAARVWVSVAGAAGIGALASAGLLHPALAVATVLLAGAGVWATARLDAAALDERARLGLGAVLAAGVLGASAALPGFGVTAFGATFLAVVLVAGTLERPVWRSLVSLTWVVALLQLVAAVVTRDRAGVALVAVGTVATLCAVVAAQRLRTATAVLAQAWREGERRGPLPAPGIRTARPRRPGILRWYVAPVVASLALVAAVVAAGTAREPLSRWAAERDGGAGQGAPQVPDASATTAASGPRTLAAYTGGALDLRVRGELPTADQLAVPNDSPTLWRAAVLDAYSGTGWTESVRYPRPLRQDPRDDGWVRVTVDGGADVDPADVAAGTRREDDVEVLADQRRAALPVVAPGVLVRVTGPVESGSPGRLTATTPAGGPARRYTVVTTARRSADDTRLPPTPVAAAPGAALDARWTALPAAVTQRTRDLARELVATAPTRADAVRAVETWLAANAVYELDSPVPPAGQDAVDHFLFDARSGFCEQFASAEVVLLRAAGVPARLVTGWASDGTAAPLSAVRGAPDPATATKVLRADQAHAWVEVWFPGAGWVTSDPTAGVPLATPGPAPEPEPQVVEPPARGWAGIAASFGVAVVLVVVGIALGAALLRRVRRPAGPPAGWPVPVEAGRTAPDAALLAAHGRLAAAYARLDATLAGRAASRAPAESLADLAARLPAPADTALAVVEQALYSRTPPTAAGLDAAARDLDAVRERLEHPDPAVLR